MPGCGYYIGIGREETKVVVGRPRRDRRVNKRQRAARKRSHR